MLPGGESNPGLPRDRRGYSPLYYRGYGNLAIQKNHNSMPKTSADLRMQPHTYIPQIKSAVFECISVEADSPSFLPYKQIWIQSLSQSFHHSFNHSFSQSFSQSVIPPFIQSFFHSCIHSLNSRLDFRRSLLQRLVIEPN